MAGKRNEKKGKRQSSKAANETTQLEDVLRFRIFMSPKAREGQQQERASPAPRRVHSPMIRPSRLPLNTAKRRCLARDGALANSPLGHLCGREPAQSSPVQSPVSGLQSLVSSRQSVGLPYLPAIPISIPIPSLASRHCRIVHRPSIASMEMTGRKGTHLLGRPDQCNIAVS